jgi:hypothetical protein
MKTRKIKNLLRIGNTKHIVITLFKLRYNLPDRVLEILVNVDHVTISRAITRMVIYMNHIIKSTNNNYYVVDSTTIRIGRGKTKKDYSDYKHYYGLKYQVICDNNKEIISVSQGYESSLHDKKLFLIEYLKFIH